ncbi:putative type IX secretion system sortase PorU2 [Flavilitoribacter nigricans]|uniref:Uncharacterized protein n=1 Tax=Flavilitoribacter nigricans (strain ATCC 23147 / DSM 23189 / NBRC 102662 / NCIMB 1420 / SS-2) TaxID=1122177 RepID=A0A2D0MYX0_FLAN2|nr:C25 family cysteine peptidase [Flavilitoribacter nigricans]PHN01464.1 hypothetical protein CRP01_36800 [Flavilitoribacter nigricans DSM 23189 = NBRC 102662]
MKHLITILFLSLSFSLHAQMWNGQDSLFGNEWIRYEQSYFKLKVAEDGIYRLNYAQLQAAGISLNEIPGQQFQMFHLGREIPIHTSRNGTLGAGDFIEFYGVQNRSELDRHLFTDPEEDLLNPEYSLFTDSSTYFLTWTTAGSPTLRYTSIDNALTGAPAPEPWYWAEEKVVFTEQHFKQYEKFAGENVYYSNFEGDGFGHPYTETTQFTLPTSNRAVNGPNATLSVNLIGNSNQQGHALQIDLNTQTVKVDTFYGPVVKKYELPVQSGQLSDAVEIAVRGNNDTDRYGVSVGKIRYARTFNFSGQDLIRIDLPAAAGKRLLAFNGLGQDPYILLDLEHNLRLITSESNGQHRVLLPAATGDRRLILMKFSALASLPGLEPVTFVDYQSSNTNYLIISNDQLFNDGLGNNWVQDYADYRASTDGGNFRPTIIEVQQLFDQFAYGIDFHPLSIRNAFHFLRRNRFPDLEFIFIIGRGQEYQNMRSSNRLQRAVEEGDMLVPSFGYPASDNLLFTTNETDVSPVPLGRLAAKDPGEVKIYLDKVRSVEANTQLPQTIADRAWTKHILHLGGGGTAGEQITIKNRLEALADLIEESTFGGSVRAFYKNSTDVIQNSLSQEIFDYINQGTSIITFFGHSSPGTFDFNIDNPDNYDNEGKYPLILSLGCYSGNVFGPSRSIGERFTFYEDKAAVIFGASRGLGVPSDLARFAQAFYQFIGEEYYGRSIGEALKAAYESQSAYNWLSIRTLVQQFNLHGDPAIRLHPVDGPDYLIDAASVRFDNQPISTLMDSLTFYFDAVNLGRNEMDTVSLVISRTFPDGEKVELLKDTIVMDRFRKQLTYTLPVGGSRSTGQNIFHVFIDADEKIAESPDPAAEMNNELSRSNGESGIPLFIIDNAARAVYPPEFALIGNSDITLKASTTNALAPERTYWLEIDTTALFNSPLKVRLTQQQRGGVLKWTPNINWQDQTAYYWRVSPAVSTDNPEPVWSNSSFTYIAGSEPGWRQGHYWQFRQNTDTDLIFTDSTQEVSFGQEFLDMRVRNKLWDADDRPGFFYNNSNAAASVRPWLDLQQGISAVVFIPDTGVPWRNSGKQYNSEDRRNQACFSFNTQTEEGRNAFIEFLTNVVPEGHIVFLFTIQSTPDADYLPENWAVDSLNTGRNIFSVLEDEGAQIIRNLETEGSVPYAFIYQKGSGARDEKIADSPDEEINVSTVLRQFQTSAQLRSKLVGPASSWGSLTWNLADELTTSGDTVEINLIGITAQGTRDTLFKQLAHAQSLEAVDASLYPYLELEYLTGDETERTPAFLRHWTVLYEGVPEFAINPSLSSYFFQADTLQQGVDLILRGTIENLSRVASDSVKIQYKLLDPQNTESSYVQVKAPLPGEGQTDFELTLPSHNWEGIYSLTTEVNPEHLPEEHHYFNNLLNQNFAVISDKKNPLLNVTFDGRILLNGDLVGTNPVINIQLKDENPNLLLSDTSLVGLQLIRPNGQTEKIYLNSPEVQFTLPTASNKNELGIEYLPTFIEDGTYQLNVNGRDVSGNFSGNIDYQVEFEVRTRNSISNVLNYPNPFTTSTQFVYTLTGTAPTFFKIQILNVSGRIVREITQDEIGPMQVGTHRTDFAWDGKDEFGDQLANGIYLYRIIAKDEQGQDYESYDNYVEDTGLSGFFERGFGKMVLLR